jgi:hypothetical protein
MQKTRNIESAVNAYNTNAQRRNIAEANFSAEEFKLKLRKISMTNNEKDVLRMLGSRDV